MMKSSSRRTSRQAGFTLLEALIALLVMAFGMLALAGMQLSLSRGADIAKQRTEAMRLAQEQMETLRSYASLTAWNALAGGTNTAATNTTYTRTWAFGGASTDTMRPVTVTVAWADRTSAADNQTVTLASVISQTDPADSGFLGFPLPENKNLKRPKNRNINIPVPAVSLGTTGKSAYQIAAGVTIVFSDISGSVVERCTGAVDATTYVAGTAGCTVLNAYILAGYVTGDITPSGTPAPAASAPFFPAPTLPTGVNTSGLNGWDVAGGIPISCIYTRATDQNDNIPPPTATIALAHYYLCIIPVTATGAGSAWSGTLRLGGLPTTSDYKVCRFQYPTSSYLTANMRNAQPYVGVNESLDNQNYYITNSGGASCPSISANVGNITRTASDTLVTTLHQDCRSSLFPNAAAIATATAANGTCPLTTHNTLP